MQLNFRVQPAVGDGPEHQGKPGECVTAYARFKAHWVWSRHPACWVLAADTLVFAADQALPKPKGREEAASMLRLLQDCGQHEVWTGLCLYSPDAECWLHADRAVVEFQPIPEQALEAYLGGVEWKDKAGAYALQGWAGRYARCVEGNPETVVGLAEEAVLALFQQAGLPPGAFLR